ncbi:MAG: DUF2804 domain-containing protein, partial [Spirochaetaceae bacterium]
RRLRFAVTGDGNGGAPGSGAPGQEAAAEVTLFQPPDQERMVIATHWPGELQAFYYNQKINCMPAEGHLDIGAERREFHQAHTFATLDWGRGRWTYRNHWYWASASGTCEGTAVGINLGYGFSDRSPATENMLFYDYRAHKLGDVGMERDPERILEPWRITDADGRLELRFRPRLNRHADFNLVLARSRQDQVFGYFDGRAVLDDGTPLYLQALPGFVEDVYNRW